MPERRTLRRALVTSTAGALLLAGLATAPAARADVIDGGTLHDGTQVTATIDVAERQIGYTFAATEGRQVSITTADSTLSGSGAAGMFLYVPVTNAGRTSYVLADRWMVSDGSTAEHQFVPTVTGTWRIRVVPADSTVLGSTTFTYAQDPSPAPLSENTPTTVATTAPGQQIRFTFTARAVNHRHLSLAITDSDWGDGSAEGHLLTPDGTLAAVVPLTEPQTFYEFTPTLEGAWSFVVVPADSAIGSLTVTLAPDQERGLLRRGRTVRGRITDQGARALFTVAGKAGARLRIRAVSSSWAPGSAYLYLLSADGGALIGHCALTDAPRTCSYYPSATGTYRLLLDPEADATGSARLRLLR